ncbi:transposase [Streptomyces decoyicus]|uniref:RNA-guided endonuclease InsQ/TnpB family protein n=1 Tax=Streptomyces decoyicus TaxID=249567 RepID=UPI00345D2F4B
MRRSYKFLLRPTGRQAGALAAMLADHRSLYNGALQERRDAYTHPSKTKIRYGSQSAQLSGIRSFDPERQGRWSFSSQQATLRRLNRSFEAFFRRVQAGEKPGYPRFKGAGHFDTVEFPRDGDGCRWDSAPHDPLTRVRFQGVGHVRVHRHRPVRGRVKTVSVKREGKRWFVVLSCDDVPAELLPPTGAVAGIDMGIAHFATTSDGEHVPNPRCGRKNAEALAHAQRELDRFPKRLKAGTRTKKHRRAAGKVAKLHAKISRQRVDHAHKTALAIVRSFDVIAHEKLRITNMVRAPKARPVPEREGVCRASGAAAKAALNRSIHDAGWGCFLGILAHKAERAGRVVIPVSPRNTSRTCPECGHVSGENRVTQAKFECVACGFAANADHVGALNILHRAGLALCVAT